MQPNRRRPSLWRLAREIAALIRRSLFPTYKWEGVYRRFAEVGSSGDAFSGEQWALDTRQLTESIIQSNKQGFIPRSVIGEQALLPLIGSVINDSRRTFRVLDFGGGTGISYVQLCSGMVRKREIEYIVVENTRVCEEGARLFADDPQIRFVTEMPEAIPDLDLVFISTALQYFENYQMLLTRLVNLRPKYILFTRLAAGEIPTYVTVQMNMQGARLPYLFVNVLELIGLLEKSGYILLFKGAGSDEINQDNFPETYRLKYCCDLLFGQVA